MFKIIKKINAIRKPKKINHSYFGHLIFYKDRKYHPCNWQGKKEIDSQSGSITVRIRAGLDGPSNEHEIFFKNLVSNFGSLVNQISHIVKPHFEAWLNKPYDDNFLKEFQCAELIIPDNGDAKKDWEITFALTSNPDFYFSVYFENGIPINTSIDS